MMRPCTQLTWGGGENGDTFQEPLDEFMAAADALYFATRRRQEARG